MGRRPKVNPKKHLCQTRLDDIDFVKLDYLMEETGLTMAEILRRGVEIQFKDYYDKVKKSVQFWN